MRLVYFDVESHLIKPGNLTPRLVCVSTAERMIGRSGGPTEPSYGPGECLTYHGEDGVSRGLYNREVGIGWIKQRLMEDETIVCGHNISYDFGVAIGSAGAAAGELLRLVFEKYRKGLVRDTQIRAQLCDIATGQMKFFLDDDGEEVRTKYTLADLAHRYCKKFLRKKDTWRLRYGELDGVPLKEWPEDARRYAIEDAVTTLEVDEAIETLASGPIPDAERQHRAAWGLHLMSAWGVRTDAEAVAKLKVSLEADYVELTEKLKPSGLLNITPARALKSGPRKGTIVPEEISRNMAAIRSRVAAAFEAQCKDEAGRHASGCGALDFGPCSKVPRTDPSDAHPYGQVATDKKTLIATGDPELKTLSQRGATEKLLDTYIPALESGTKVPITPRYNPLVETGRTSCSKPNIQNPPRKGGVRTCFVPRDGWVYAFSDYDTLELRALSQACLDLLGKSEMAEALRRGEDLHYALAAEMNEISYAEITARAAAGDQKAKDDRQFCKIPNFGFPGGLSAPTFIEYAAQFDYVVTLEKAQEMRALWLKRWPEMNDYFELMKRLTNTDAPVRQLRSGRVRGGASFCATANGFFQGLAADGAKSALWAVQWECYIGTKWNPNVGEPGEGAPTDEPSPLAGTRPVLFIHDEIGIEIPWKWWGAERSAAAAERLGEVMREVMKRWIPDIPIHAKPVMCRRWYKGVERVEINGKLVPARPEIKEVGGKKKTYWVADVPDWGERAAA